MLQRAFQDGSGVDTSIKLIVLAHLSTLDSFAQYYMPRRLLFRQDIHKVATQVWGSKQVHITSSLFVHDSKDWNKQVKKS